MAVIAPQDRQKEGYGNFFGPESRPASVALEIACAGGAYVQEEHRPGVLQYDAGP
jgi:hypothetical protein